MILVAGATGALGGAIARELLAQGEVVRVLVRSGSDYGGLVEAGAQPVMGEFKDMRSLRRACSGVRTVITTANSAQRGGADTVDTVERTGNRSLIDAAAAEGVEHFVFVSALGAHVDSPVDFLKAKAESEWHLQASGMTWTVLQPNIFVDVWVPIIVGYPLSQGRPIMLVAPGRARHALVTMRDVTAFAVAAVRNAAARNATVVIAGPEAISWSEVVRRAGAVMGRELPVEMIAPGEPLPDMPPVVSGLAASFETYETVIDMSATAARFGVQLTSIDTWLAAAFGTQVEA